MKNLDMEPKEPFADSSVSEMKRVLAKVAGSLGLVLVDDGFVFFALENDPEKYPVGPMASAPKHVESFRRFLNNHLCKDKTWSSSTSALVNIPLSNPFYGCKSLEEVELRADLLGKKEKEKKKEKKMR